MIISGWLAALVNKVWLKDSHTWMLLCTAIYVFTTAAQLMYTTWFPSPKMFPVFGSLLSKVCWPLISNYSTWKARKERHLHICCLESSLQVAGERVYADSVGSRHPTRNFKPKAPVNPAVPYLKSEFSPRAELGIIRFYSKVSSQVVDL